MSKVKFPDHKNFFGGTKVLVCGGAGFVGTNLIKQLLDFDAKVFATIHRKKPQIIDKRIKYIKADLTKSSDCNKVVKNIDYIFMCAANTSGAAVIEKTPLVHVTPNVIMNTLMLEAAYELHIKKFLFISSSAVYPPFNHPVKEDEMMKGEPYEKYFPVAWMKRFSEILCEIYATKIKNPMKVVVIRPANVYGPYDDFDWETSHVVPALMRKVIERHSPIEVWGNGRDVKDLIYVDDLVEGMILAMEKIRGFKPINIGIGQPISVLEVLKTIMKVDRYEDAKIVFNNSKPTMIPRRLIDVSLSKKLLGFKARTSLSKGIEKTLNWYRLFLKNGPQLKIDRKKSS